MRQYTNVMVVQTKAIDMGDDDHEWRENVDKARECPLPHAQWSWQAERKRPPVVPRMISDYGGRIVYISDKLCMSL